jgi:hypothetical protein
LNDVKIKVKIQENIKRIKSLMEEKGKPIAFPSNDTEAIAIREQEISGMYTASVGVGQVKVNESTSRYFDITGRVFDDTMNKFYDGVLRIEPKVVATTKGLEYICCVFDAGLIRAVDEASWANAFESLEDLEKVLVKLGHDELKSLFDSLRT